MIVKLLRLAKRSSERDRMESGYLAATCYE